MTNYRLMPVLKWFNGRSVAPTDKMAAVQTDGGTFFAKNRRADDSNGGTEYVPSDSGGDHGKSYSSGSKSASVRPTFSLTSK